MNRTTLSFIAGVGALAAVTGFAALTSPDASGASPAKAATPISTTAIGQLSVVAGPKRASAAALRSTITGQWIR